MDYATPANIDYYDLQRHWTKRIMPHLKDEKLNEILVRDFNRYTWDLWGKEFKPGDLPEQFESCDWRCFHRGPAPRFWAYTKHGACHWLVNFALRLATLVKPEKPWRILNKPTTQHSLGWGKHTVRLQLAFDGSTRPSVFREGYARRRDDEARRANRSLLSRSRFNREMHVRYQAVYGA